METRPDFWKLALSKCRGCGANIVWFTTNTGKAAPLDAEKTGVMTPEGKMVYGRIPHFSTCPEAEKFRQSRKEKAIGN